MSNRDVPGRGAGTAVDLEDAPPIGVEGEVLVGSPARGGGRQALVRSSLWASCAEGGRVVTQALLVILLARFLGPSSYGRFVGTTDFLQLMGPFVWFGAMNLLVKRYAQGDSTYSDAVSLSMCSVVMYGTVAIGVFTLIARPVLFSSMSVASFVTLAATELLFVGFIETFAYGAVARDRLRQAAGIRWLAGLSRLALMGIYLLLLPRTESAWYVCYLIGTVLSACGVYLIARRAGGFHLSWRLPARSDITAGFSFALAGMSFGVQDNIDKPLVLSLSSASAAGTYEAGYRVVSGLMTPFRAVLQATYARFFRVGNEGAAASARLARRLLVPMLAFAVAIGVVMLVLAPQIAGIFGKGFGGTASVLRWFALFPVLRTISAFVGDAITGANMHALRSRIIACTAIFNLVLNLVLIPRYSWRGAAAATLVTEALLGAAYVVVLVVVVHRGRDADVVAPAA